MNRLTVDDATGAHVSDQRSPLEICDPSGRVPGFFYPLAIATHPADQSPHSPFSVEELQKSRLARTGAPLQMVLARLSQQ